MNNLKTIFLPLFAAFALAVSSAAFADEGHQKNVVPSPLIHASSHGDVAEVKRLLNDGANPNATGEYGMTALMYATWKGHADVAELLLSAGADPNAADNGGGTALMSAAYQGAYNKNASLVKLLLSADANPNAAADNGRTALMQTTYKAHAEIVKLLLSAGANPNAKDKDGKTALSLANRFWSKSDTQEDAKEYREIVRLLKEAGAK